MLLLALGYASGAGAQASDPQYFRETGHTVSGEFLAYYRSFKDAVQLFGYPITEAYPKDGLLVQYFQRARFELHPELPAGQRVQLTALGSEVYQPGDPTSNNPDLSCRLFPETGFAVCYSFLDFFDQHGGVAVFGYPISSFEFRGDKLTVQYFEKARFEWRADLPEGQRVRLTDLGRIYFDMELEDVNLLKPIPFEEVNRPIPLLLHSRAFSWKAVVLPTDQQIIYVVAQDQILRPISGATGTATILWPNGRRETLTLITNSNGFGSVPLAFADLPPGSLIIVEISLTKDGLTSATRTSFRIWY
ncbi:MAG: hypothetical protein HFACDABA_02403 [Anaerolineales bacterium]|nr:hypothetical protein [Anaerolineales bacterium]